jgi:hypothetical protein
MIVVDLPFIGGGLAVAAGLVVGGRGRQVGGEQGGAVESEHGLNEEVSDGAEQVVFAGQARRPSSFDGQMPAPPPGVPRAAGLGPGPAGVRKGGWETSGNPWGCGEGCTRGVPHM